MKSKFFLGATCVAFLVTALAYTPVVRHLVDQNSKSSTVVGEAFEYGATNLTAVGWESCTYCQKFKMEVVPSLQAEGYNVKYIDRDLWKGPRVRIGPTMFFYRRGVIVKIHQGFMTAEEVKEWLKPASPLEQ